MMNLNKVMLIGNVGRIEVKQFNDGKLVNASLAVSEKYTSRDGSRVENTTWFEIVINGKLADIAEQYIGKGDRLYVEGRMRQRKYLASDGTERTAWEVVARDIIMLSERKAEAPAEDDLPADFM